MRIPVGSRKLKSRSCIDQRRALGNVVARGVQRQKVDDDQIAGAQQWRDLTVASDALVAVFEN